MTIINPVRQKWIASVTCAAAAICTVFAGIGQQLITRFVRDWDLEPPAIARHAGLGVIVTLFLVVMALNAVRFFWVHSEEIGSMCTFIAIACVVGLFLIMSSYFASIMMLFSHAYISP